MHGRQGTGGTVLSLTAPSLALLNCRARSGAVKFAGCRPSPGALHSATGASHLARQPFTQRTDRALSGRRDSRRAARCVRLGTPSLSPADITREFQLSLGADRPPRIAARPAAITATRGGM